MHTLKPKIPRKPASKADSSVVDIGDNLARLLEKVLTTNHDEIKEILNTIMSAIENLRTAVNNVQTTATDGFAAMELAFTELATDIGAIPASQDVDAEAARLSGVATALGASAASFSQRLRDALPTAPATDPLPPPDEEVPPTDPNPPADGPTG